MAKKEIESDDWYYRYYKCNYCGHIWKYAALQKRIYTYVQFYKGTMKNMTTFQTCEKCKLNALHNVVAISGNDDG